MGYALQVPSRTVYKTNCVVCRVHGLRAVVYNSFGLRLIKLKIMKFAIISLYARFLALIDLVSSLSNHDRSRAC